MAQHGLSISNGSVVHELRVTLSQINSQIEAVKKDVANSYPVHIEFKEDIVYRTKHTDGKYVLTDLLVAKANCLAAIATLQAPVRR